MEGRLGLGASTSGRLFASSSHRPISSHKQLVGGDGGGRHLVSISAWRLASAAEDTDASAEQDEGKAPTQRMMAAMALSPIAAMSLPLLQNEEWAQSMRDFGQNLRQNINSTVTRDSFREWAAGLDRGITFMDWTYKHTGIDLTYVWDPELWIKFKDAIWHDHPQLFWNELADRIEYSENTDST